MHITIQTSEIESNLALKGSVKCPVRKKDEFRFWKFLLIYCNFLITREPLTKRLELFKVFKGYLLEYLPTSSKSGLSTLRNSEFSLHMIVAVLLMLWSKASSPKASPSDISPTTWTKTLSGFYSLTLIDQRWLSLDLVASNAIYLKDDKSWTNTRNEKKPINVVL